MIDDNHKVGVLYLGYDDRFSVDGFNLAFQRAFLLPKRFAGNPDVLFKVACVY